MWISSSSVTCFWVYTRRRRRGANVVFSWRACPDCCRMPEIMGWPLKPRVATLSRTPQEVAQVTHRGSTILRRQSRGSQYHKLVSVSVIHV